MTGGNASAPAMAVAFSFGKQGGITMAIGQRIRFFRNRKGMTQKQLGEVLGFLGKTSDVRMAQYESEARVPKHDLVKEMAGIFDVSTHALTVPDIDTYIGLMHTFFALEDMYGLKIDEMDGEVVLRLDKSDYSTYSSMEKMLRVPGKKYIRNCRVCISSTHSRSRCRPPDGTGIFVCRRS